MLLKLLALGVNCVVYGDRGYRGCEGVIVCDSRVMVAFGTHGVELLCPFYNVVSMLFCLCRITLNKKDPKGFHRVG